MRLDHLALPSFDAAATHRFYAEVLGCTLFFGDEGVSPEWGGKRYLMRGYRFGASDIYFFDIAGQNRPASDGLPEDVRHVAFDVRDRRAMAAWKRRLKKHGVAFVEEDHDGYPSIYFTDPNGHRLELTVHWPVPRHAKARAAAAEVVGRWIR